MIIIQEKKRFNFKIVDQIDIDTKQNKSSIVKKI
jgi:hypothetical protein